MATVVILVGMPRSDRPVSIATAPGATAAPTSPATIEVPTPLPSTADPTVEPSAPAVADSLSAWGITIKRDTTRPWQAVADGFDGDRLGLDVVGNPVPYVLISTEDHAADDIFFGPCSNGDCGRPVITVSLARNGAGLLGGTTGCAKAPASFVIDCMVSNDVWPVTVAAVTLDQLQRGWLKTFGDAVVTRMRLDGVRAILLERADRRTVLAVHGAILVAIITQPPGGESPEEGAQVFDAVIRNFRFDG